MQRCGINFNEAMRWICGESKTKAVVYMSVGNGPTANSERKRWVGKLQIAGDRAWWLSTTLYVARRLLRYRYIGMINEIQARRCVVPCGGDGFRSRAIKRNKKVMNGTTGAARGQRLSGEKQVERVDLLVQGEGEVHRVWM